MAISSPVRIGNFSRKDAKAPRFGKSPKTCLNLAFKNSWIIDEPAWLATLVDHNQNSHTDDETLAKAVYGRLRNYLPLIEGLAINLTP